MKKKEILGNRGFSLVELVIVMAIIVILSLAAFSGIRLLASRPVDECAKKIQIALEGNRNTTMGKFSASLLFYMDSDGSIMVREVFNAGTPEEQLETSKIGQSGVSVKCMMKDGSEVDLSTGSVIVEFNRASGSVMNSPTGTVKSFVVSRGNRVLTVNIDTLTGRVDVQ